MKEHKAEAKAMHARKLAGYGGKSRGTDFSDKGKFAGSAPPVGTETQRADEIKPGLGSLVRTVKKGGAVEGDKPMKRLDRKPRKSGGRVAKAGGGELPSPMEAMRSEERMKNIRSRAAETKLPSAREAAESAARVGEKCGGSVKRASGGKVGDKVSREAWEHSPVDLEQDKKLARKHGKSLKEWEESKADERHDQQQSTEGLKKGGRAKRAEGGRVGKGKTNITIHIAPPGGQQPMPLPLPMPGPGAAPPPPPPPGGPPPMGAPAGPPLGLAALMGRKAGGRVNQDIDVKKPRKAADGTIGLDGGALGGVARRQKIELQGKS